MVDFFRYMNNPECPLAVGDICERDDMLFCDIKYKVVEVLEKNNKYYVVCEYYDEFDDCMKREEFYTSYLRKVN